MSKRDTNLFIKLLLIIFLIILLMFVLQSANKLDEEVQNTPHQANFKILEVQPSKELEDSPVLFKDLSYAIYYDPAPTKEFIIKVQNGIDELENINKNDYTNKAINAMTKELARLKEIKSKMTSDLNKYLKWEDEYYYTTKVWEFLRQRNFSQEVTCGIIGNMMVETSGGTLDLKPNIYSTSKNYYGLCQWSLKYYPGTKDLPFEHQLDYLLGSMPWEFNTFGKNYKVGFDYEEFLKIDDPAEAALAFAKVYERCGQVSYKLRQKAAIKAYDYFNLWHS